MDIGSAVGRQLGLSEEKLATLHRFEEEAGFTPLEKLVLRYTTAITQTPVDVSNAVFDELKGRFNEKQLVELTSCIAWENHRARFDHALGIESENFSEGAVCAPPVVAL